MYLQNTKHTSCRFARILNRAKYTIKKNWSGELDKINQIKRGDVQI